MSKNKENLRAEEVISVPVKSLIENMVIGEEIKGSSGQVLVSKGFELKNQKTVERVQKFLDDNKIEIVRIIADNEIMEILKSIQEKEVETVQHKKPSYGEALGLKKEKDKELFDRLLPKYKKDITDKLMALFEGAEPSEIASIEEDIKKSMQVIEASVNVFQMLETMKKMDHSLYFYSYSVALTAYMLGNWMGLKQKQKEALFITAMVADVGILKLPEDKMYRHQWKEQEENQYYQHVVYSYSLLEKCSFLTGTMLDSILYHHEKYDGTGYPRGLKGTEIPLFSRILYIADLYTHYMINKGYNPLHTVHEIKEKHLKEVDLYILFTLSERVGNYFTGQKFKTKNADLLEGEIIMLDKGTSHLSFDSRNVYVYVRRKDKSIINIPLHTFHQEDVEFI
ncbi:HD domain-containing protein [Natronincola peptidivorans]|uniref:HD domain-containing protein n=1 Tax=Natronincola peptidivorans TaxID=426128 RepID=A0A1H9ZL46_9FIRM|nr:HD domain-containing phosphohydrolase [Natronincola peptidivorans]SES81858.1 HD domain-containing protein [Natronincola peptidivorans]